jgi:hypothetical protein
VITLDPARLVDSRFGSGYQTVDGQQQGIGRRAAGQTTIVPVSGRTGIPAGAVTAILNIVAINAERQGFAAIYDCDEDRPNTSTLNLGAGTDHRQPRDHRTRHRRSGVRVHTTGNGPRHRRHRIHDLVRADRP